MRKQQYNISIIKIKNKQGKDPKEKINMTSIKRDVKEAAEAREMAYDIVQTATDQMFLDTGFEIVGRATEGLIVRDRDADTYLVIKAIAKQLDFDAEDAMEEYAEKQERAKEREAKAAKKKADLEARRAKAAKEKAEKEAKKEAEGK